MDSKNLKLDSVASWLSPGKVHYGFVLKDAEGGLYGFEVTSKVSYENAMTKTIRRMDIVDPFLETMEIHRPAKPDVIPEASPGEAGRDNEVTTEAQA